MGNLDVDGRVILKCILTFCNMTFFSVEDKNKPTKCTN